MSRLAHFLNSQLAFELISLVLGLACIALMLVAYEHSYVVME